MSKIVENKAKCKFCNDILISESISVKPKTCKCGNLIISGGEQKLIRFHRDQNNNFRNAIENKEYIEESTYLITE